MHKILTPFKHVRVIGLDAQELFVDHLFRFLLSVGHFLAFCVQVGVLDAYFGFGEVESHAEKARDVGDTGAYLLKIEAETEVEERLKNLLIIEVYLLHLKERLTVEHFLINHMHVWQWRMLSKSDSYLTIVSENLHALRSTND